MFRFLTTKKERLLIMKDVLSASPKEVLKLFGEITDKLCGEDCEKWLEALRLFSREEPNWVEGMIYIPLEWGLDMGEVALELIEDRIKLHEKGFACGWRLPTDKELSRALKLMKVKFVVGEYFWSSTDDSNNHGHKIIRTSDGCGGLECSGSRCFYSTNQKHPRLRLCRPITIPE
jgi:hypothetical protein